MQQQRLRIEPVGREWERAELASALQDAAAGRGSVVVLLGDAGMGKSTLAAWTVSRAADAGMTVAQGGCSAAGMPPLWPVRRALVDIAPGLRWRDESAATAGSDREMLAASVVEAVAVAARGRPLLLVLEDLHWADPASLMVVRAIADAVSALPVVLLLSARDDPGDASPEIRDQIGQLPTHSRRMVLPPLDDAGVAALAAQELAGGLAERDVRDLRSRTGGNPFFVHEVLRLQAAHGAGAALIVPPGVSEVIQRRVARVSQECSALLAVAAVAAETCAGAIEEDLAAADPDAAALLNEAVAARLVDDLPSGRSFRHALIHEVIESGLSAAERSRLHALVAARLEHRDDPRDPPARLAHHWARASGVQAGERAAHWSLLAARAAVAEFGFEAAVDHFRRVLQSASTDRVGVSIELGEALRLIGDVDAARDVLLAAARDAEWSGRPVELARAALALGGGLAGFEVPIADELQAALLARADEMLPGSQRAWRAAVRGRLSLTRAGVMSAEARIALAEDAVRLASEAGDAAIQSAVLAAYCDAIAGPDFVRERISAAGRIVTLTESGTSVHDRASALLARRLLLVAHLENGDLSAAERQALAYERVASRLAIPLYSWLPEIWRGMRALLDGDTDTALHRADAAEAIGRRANSLNAELMVFALRMQAYLDRGTPAAYADTVRAVLNGIGPTGMPAMYLAAPGWFLLRAGDLGPARSALRAFESGDRDAMPQDAEWLESHWAMANIAIELGDGVAAQRLYDALLPYARLWAVDGLGGAVFGVIAEQLGRLAAHLGRTDDAARHLATARERYERQGAPALLRRLDSTRRASDERARIHHDGATWQLDWYGRRTTVPDAKGMHDLAVLLARPGRPIPALDLVAAAGGPPAESAGGGLGPVLDDTARRAYRERLAELEHDLDEAEAVGDSDRTERIREERALLAHELAAAVGLGGRARMAGDPADRARKAVTMRIRAAIRTIDGHDSALARHLTNAVRTGRLCSYEPEVPVRWQT
ncbi:MAG TPA: AAA family ATPase [Jatrophihabitans sp.]|nr:AAA family ATPase [Jatrophihabitans sp.]